MEIGTRHLMMKEAFGTAPLVYSAAEGKRLTFLNGEGLKGIVLPDLPSLKEVTEQFTSDRLAADVSTDDWPFFYMPVRKFPLRYVIMLAVLFIISLLFVFTLTPSAEGRFSWPCFFLGAGFMLLETKAITELALVFGTTWFVNSIVIAAILVMAFLSNLIVMKKGSLPRALAYLMLLCAVGIGLGFAYLKPPLQSACAAYLLFPAILTFPIFFSGFVFSLELKGANSIAEAISSNLLGAMLGGMLEYNAMAFGFRFLYFLALAMYTFAFLTRWRTLRT